MAKAPPPQDLTCPDPDGCPVAPDLPSLRTLSLAKGTAWYRIYDATWGYDEHNPGYGDARFSPIDDPKTTQRLPSLYLAATPTAVIGPWSLRLSTVRSTLRMVPCASR